MYLNNKCTDHNITTIKDIQQHKVFSTHIHKTLGAMFWMKQENIIDRLLTAEMQSKPSVVFVEWTPMHLIFTAEVFFNDTMTC